MRVEFGVCSACVYSPPLFSEFCPQITNYVCRRNFSAAAACVSFCSFCFLSLCVAITKSKNKHLFFIGIVSVMKHIFYFIQPFDIGSMTQNLGWFLLHGTKL